MDLLKIHSQDFICFLFFLHFFKCHKCWLYCWLFIISLHATYFIFYILIFLLKGILNQCLIMSCFKYACAMLLCYLKKRKKKISFRKSWISVCIIVYKFRYIFVVRVVWKLCGASGSTVRGQTDALFVAPSHNRPWCLLFTRLTKHSRIFSRLYHISATEQLCFFSPLFIPILWYEFMIL